MRCYMCVYLCSATYDPVATTPSQLVVFPVCFLKQLRSRLLRDINEPAPCLATKAEYPNRRPSLLYHISTTGHVLRLEKLFHN